jgi:hypothetical protein
MELLNEVLQNELLIQPETGMGYQDVEIVLKNGDIHRGTVFNSEYLVYQGESRVHLKRIEEPSQRLLLLERKELGLGTEIVSLQVVHTAAESSARVREDNEVSTKSSGADQAPEEALQQPETFKRFSAFAKDRRVTSAGGLLPGTYATTAADARYVKTGRDAVKRYALPNPKPAIHVFTIDPPVKTKLKRGIVQPAYGQPGGGVEVIFVNGSPANTVTGPAIIPP